MYFSYPNASKGLKWMFIARILAIAAIPLSLVLMGSLAAIAGLVLELAGLYYAARDDQNYRPAFYAGIAAIVIDALSAFLDEGFLSTALGLVNSLVSLFVVYQVCVTTDHLLANRDPALSQRGTTVLKLYAVCTLVSVVCTILSVVPLLNYLAAVVGYMAAVASIVGYVLYLMYLYRASAALQ